MEAASITSVVLLVPAARARSARERRDLHWIPMWSCRRRMPEALNTSGAMFARMSLFQYVFGGQFYMQVFLIGWKAV